MKTKTIQHTPGPWHVGFKASNRYRIDATDGGPVAHTAPNAFVQVNGIPGEVNRPGEANARLIAAAPELLVTAQEMRRVLDVLTDPTYGLSQLARDMLAKYIVQADATIAKATGGDA